MTSSILPNPVNEALAIARSQGDWARLKAIGKKLERFGDYGRAWAALADSAELRTASAWPEWQGQPLRHKSLLVERRSGGIGAELRMARFLVPAAEAGCHVTAAVEPRLVPLVRRSFPQVEVIDNTVMQQSRLSPDFAASYQRLAQHFGGDAQAIVDSFQPLVPDRIRRDAFRQAYERSSPVVIGIAWHSVNPRKLLPSLENWSELLRALDVQYVSLQYDEHNAGIARLAESAQRDILPSGELDQFQDLDGFAAQVAAVDFVVTISNTTAHMAGALGIPSLVLLDDLAHLAWPAAGDKTPLYPATRLLRANGRDGAAVLRAAIPVVEHMLADRAG